jgi:hypothetical protein
MPATATTARGLPGKGGRPKKAEHERRIASLRADVTLAEKAHVADLAKAAGVSQGEFIRRRALGLPVVVLEAKTDARLIHELNAIGVNLNQIARNVNADRLGAPGSRLSDLEGLQRQLRDVLDRALESFDDD